MISAIILFVHCPKHVIKYLMVSRQFCLICVPVVWSVIVGGYCLLLSAFQFVFLLEVERSLQVNALPAEEWAFWLCCWLGPTRATEQPVGISWLLDSSWVQRFVAGSSNPGRGTFSSCICNQDSSAPVLFPYCDRRSAVWQQPPSR